MNGAAGGVEYNGQDILIVDVSDVALEVAASAPPGAAFSFPNAPTVSVLFACCSNDDTRGRG